MRIASVATLLMVFHMARGAASAGEVSELIDEIVRQPGFERQICSFDTNDSPAPVPVYSVGARGQYLISATNFARLRDQRGPVIAELRDRLRRIRFGGPQAGDDAGRAKLSQHELVMLIDLNAVEALPELLRVEFELFQNLEWADGKSELPKVPYDASFAYLISAGATAADRERIARKTALETAHRDVLGVMTAILRQERLPALLESEIEKEYRQVLEAGPGAKDETALTENQKLFTSIDPLHGTRVWGGTATLRLPWSGALRERIVSLARDHVAAAPSRNGAVGMSEWPVTR